MLAPKDAPPHANRADLILTATIGFVCVLVLSLLLVLAAAARLHEQSDDARAVNRVIRNEAIAFTQSMADAVSAQGSYIYGGDHQDLDQYNAAKVEARRHLAELQRLTADLPQVPPLVARIHSLAENEITVMDQGVAHPRGPHNQNDDFDKEIRSTTDEFHAVILRRADLIRADEETARARLDSIAVALALLSLVTAALAILALRRERAQWAKANAALADAHAKAAASDLAKTRFLAAASHDMRQPLHALSLYIGALQRRVDTGEARDILTKMERAALSMSGMFSTLLDLARIQANVVTPEIENFPLQDAIDRVVAEYPGERIAATPAPFEVRTDPLLLERLLRNLVSNALRHGGGAARIEVKPSGSFAEIAVIDEGPGIREEDQERIFDEFVRLDGRAGGEGLGLGLSIVKRIADLLGLDLHLRSAPGHGAAFIVNVPMTALRPIITPREPVGERSFKGMRVLMMDDDHLALEAAAGMLRDGGAEVRACARESDVTAALADGFAPHLMVMDLRIDGDLAGVAIADRARAKFEHPPKVIMVTGDTAPEALTALRASGHQWLIKPVSPRDLMEAVETAVST